MIIRIMRPSPYLVPPWSVVVVSFLCWLAVLAISITSAHAWVAPSTTTTTTSTISMIKTCRRSSTQQAALPAAAASLIAGSIAGSVGVGVAFPLDTIKTKAQVLATSRCTTKDASTQRSSKNTVATESSEDISDSVMISMSPSGVAAAAISPPSVALDGGDMISVGRYIYQTQGIAGFFSGVQTSMVGQAIIKAVVFAVNAGMLDALRDHAEWGIQDTPSQLFLAAATAGFVTSFLAAPVDRIKVLMQASASCAINDAECVQSVLKTEGWKGLMGRGLACTMIREVPAYSLYFSVYGGLQAWTPVTEWLGPAAPLLYGAAAGCACWIPIYPIDVVKTVIQNTQGGGDQSNQSPLQVASDLYKQHGLSVFWDGISPRLLRQAVNHAVTFSVYDALMHSSLVMQ